MVSLRDKTFQHSAIKIKYIIWEWNLGLCTSGDQILKFIYRPTSSILCWQKIFKDDDRNFTYHVIDVHCLYPCVCTFVKK